jgi:hypothetical protein
MQHDDQEEFQRQLLLSGESIHGVYPALSDANKAKFQEFLKRKKQ